jgi:hypothetical protein
MTEQKDDMIPNENKLPNSLDGHLRAIMEEKELSRFKEQLPAEFLSDASEGLAQLKDTKQLESVLQHLNKQMHQQLKHTKTRRKRRSIGDLSWTYWAIMIILLLVIVGYVVVRMLLH